MNSHTNLNDELCIRNGNLHRMRCTLGIDAKCTRYVSVNETGTGMNVSGEPANQHAQSALDIKLWG